MAEKELPKIPADDEQSAVDQELEHQQAVVLDEDDLEAPFVDEVDEDKTGSIDTQESQDNDNHDNSGHDVDTTTNDVESNATFVREPRARQSMPPINDDSLMQITDGYTHDSDFTNDGISGSGRGYRTSKNQMEVLRRDLHYGQYLEIPKGRRDIFVSRERSTRMKTLIALVVVLALLAAAAYFVVIYLQSQFG